MSDITNEETHDPDCQCAVCQPGADHTFPTLGELFRALKHLSATVDEECDVRLQVVDGGWSLHSGDASFDQDHRGSWGASSVGPDETRGTLFDIAKDLIDQARDMQAQGED